MTIIFHDFIKAGVVMTGILTDNFESLTGFEPVWEFLLNQYFSVHF
jgi:hypothetical protein